MERNSVMMQQHEQEAVDGHPIGLLHADVEQEVVQQGNCIEPVAGTGTSAASSSFPDSLPYGASCPIHPVQQLFSDMTQLSLQLNSGALQQQLHHHEQKQSIRERQESDEADDDALLRDAVEAAQRSDSQIVERLEMQDAVQSEQKTEIGHLENEESEEVTGHLHR